MLAFPEMRHKAIAQDLSRLKPACNWEGLPKVLSHRMPILLQGCKCISNASLPRDAPQGHCTGPVVAEACTQVGSLEGLLTGSSEAKDRGAAVRTPVQTPENVARSEKTAALREEAKVCLKQYCAHQSVCYVNYVSQEGQQQPCCTIDKDDAVSKRTGRAAL